MGKLKRVKDPLPWPWVMPSECLTNRSCSDNILSQFTAEQAAQGHLKRLCGKGSPANVFVARC